MGEGHGFGKVILFGEHFVVHRIPGIASAIGAMTTARVEKAEGEGIKIEDNRPATPGYIQSKLEQQRMSLDNMMNAAGFDAGKTPIKITLGGDLFVASGIGASAASCTAIARALSDEFGLGFSDERINEIAYEGEKAYAGNPSGIDNTAATFGGLIWFKKGDPNVIERVKLREPVEIVMGNTGINADTERAVAGVAERKEQDPEKYNKLFNQAGELALEARKALEGFDLQRVGELMNDNHRLLQGIEVSCEELDMLVDLARKNGAIGAKMTGGGLGGNMVALTPGKELQERVAKAIQDAGFEVLKTRVGV